MKGVVHCVSLKLDVERDILTHVFNCEEAKSTLCAPRAKWLLEDLLLPQPEDKTDGSAAIITGNAVPVTKSAGHDNGDLV